MNGTVVIGVVLTLVGVAGVLGQSHWLLLALRSRAWTPTPGTVVSSRTRAVPAHRPGSAAQYHVPAIHYSYRVDNQAHEGSLVTFRGLVAGFEVDADRLVARYQRGQRVTVWFDPLDPTRAVLEPGPGWTSWARLVLAIGFLTAGLWLIGMGLGGHDFLRP